MLEIITRKDALARGLTRYFTGKPCERGHVVERLASASNCTECVRLRDQTPTHKDYRRQYMQGYMQGYRQRERR